MSKNLDEGEVRFRVRWAVLRRPLLAVACAVALLGSTSAARADKGGDPDAFLGGSLFGVGGTFNEGGGRAAYTPAFWIGGGIPLGDLFHLGGLLRFQGYVPGGVDVGLAARFAFGPMPFMYLSFDTGPSLRTWGGGAYGRVPLDFGLTASIVGVQLAGTMSPVDLWTGSGEKSSFALTAGIDVAQMTLAFAAIAGALR